MSKAARRRVVRRNGSATKRPPKNPQNAAFLKRVCVNKKKHKTLEAAQSHANRLNAIHKKSEDNKWIGYDCPHCDFYHAGRPNRPA